MEKKLEEQLKSKFRNILCRYNELYFKDEDVPDLLEWCNDNDVIIVGIEGFEFKDNFLKPRLDLIADFSSGIENIEDWSISRMYLNQAARNFFKGIEKKGVIFNFVLKEPQI